MSTISVRLSEGLEKQLSKESKTEGKPRSELVRQAITEFISRRERERFMSELLTEANQAYSNPEIQQEINDIKEDFYLLDAIGTDRPQDSERAEQGEENERWWK